MDAKFPCYILRDLNSPSLIISLLWSSIIARFEGRLLIQDRTVFAEPVIRFSNNECQSKEEVLRGSVLACDLYNSAYRPILGRLYFIALYLDCPGMSVIRWRFSRGTFVCDLNNSAYINDMCIDPWNVCLQKGRVGVREGRGPVLCCGLYSEFFIGLWYIYVQWKTVTSSCMWCADNTMVGAVRWSLWSRDYRVASSITPVFICVD